MDRVRREVLVRRLLRPFLGEEDEAAHEPLKLGRVRGEEGLQVFVRVVDRAGLFGGRGREQAKVLGAAEVEFESRRPKSGVVRSRDCAGNDTGR